MKNDDKKIEAFKVDSYQIRMLLEQRGIMLNDLKNGIEKLLSIEREQRKPGFSSENFSQYLALEHFNTILQMGDMADKSCLPNFGYINPSLN